jgi:4-azaleucine resistance transporter AzlC
MEPTHAIEQTRTRRQEFIAGMQATIPLELGAIPFGIIFGALAVTGDRPLTPAAAMGMSAFVFAGSAQFIGVNLYAQGLALPFIVLTTFIVNLRHALYSASLAPYMKHLPQRWLLPLGFWLTDESYAIVIQRYSQPDASPYKHWFYFGSAVMMYVNWQLFTLVGILAGQIISQEQAQSLGLDFSIVVTFIGIVVPLLVTRPMLLSALAAGITAVALDGLPNKMGLMIAALVGIAAGYIAETYFSTPKTDRDSSTPAPLIEQEGQAR